MDEVTDSGLLDRNERTRISDLGSDLDEPLGPREAFVVAYDRLRDLASVAPSGALVVAAVGPMGRVVDSMPILDRTAVIVGRHSMCDLRLSTDSVSLRHLAVLARSDRGRPTAHLWDLNTQQPFVTEDGTESSALVADGPVYAAVGEHALWVLPAEVARAWHGSATETWATLPPRQLIDRRAPPLAGAARPARAAMPSPVSRSSEVTRVTVIAAPLLVGDGDEPEVGWGTLRFEVAGQKLKRHVSAERLEQGLLVGRYDRCGASFTQSNQVSRVHLLLVRIGDEVWAIDAASTNGVKRNGTVVRAEVLADSDEVTLGGALTVRWRREKHAQA